SRHHTPRRSTLFPYTTLFRSREEDQDVRPINSAGEPAHAAGRVIVGERVEVQLVEIAIEKLRGSRLALLCRIAEQLHLHGPVVEDRKSTRLNSSHDQISYAVF